MGVENNQTIEERELLQLSHHAWLAGALEVGGYADIIMIGDEVRPAIHLQDVDHRFALQLNDRFGNHSEDWNTRSLAWRIVSAEAAQLLSSIRPFTVARAALCDAAAGLMYADTQEQIRIVKKLHEEDVDRTDAHTQQYDILLRNPAFVAGVLDNRGKISKRERGIAQRYPRIRITSSNRKILDAIQKQFSGSVRLWKPAGTEVEIDGVRTTTTKDSLRWESAHKSARRMIAFVINHLAIPPYEGWDVRRSDMRGQEREERNRQIIEYVRAEVQKHQDGDLSRLSNRRDIQNRFRIGKTTAQSVLSQLPDEMRAYRNAVIKKQSFEK